MKRFFIILTMALAILFPFRAVSASDNCEKINGMVDAINAATVSYASTLQDERKRFDWEYADYVADIRNYSIGAAESKVSYVIVFSLRGKEFLGGGATFFIRKSDLHIAKIIRSK